MTRAATTSELMPCAHCGGEAKAKYVYSTSSIFCADCCTATARSRDTDTAIAAWNRRAPDPRIADLEAANRALIEERDEFRSALADQCGRTLAAEAQRDAALRRAEEAQALYRKMKEAVKFAHAHGFEWPSDPLPLPLRSYQTAEKYNPQPADYTEGEVRELVAALRRVRTAAVLLLNSAEGCAVNHYGDDFATHGMPGWLVDARADAMSADALLSRHAATKEPDEGDGPYTCIRCLTSTWNDSDICDDCGKEPIHG